MDKVAVARELMAIADLVAVKFDTRKEMEEYKREHRPKPGTELKVRDEREMKERYKDRKI